MRVNTQKLKAKKMNKIQNALLLALNRNSVEIKQNKNWKIEKIKCKIISKLEQKQNPNRPDLK